MKPVSDTLALGWRRWWRRVTGRVMVEEGSATERRMSERFYGLGCAGCLEFDSVRDAGIWLGCGVDRGSGHRGGDRGYCHDLECANRS